MPKKTIIIALVLVVIIIAFFYWYAKKYGSLLNPSRSITGNAAAPVAVATAAPTETELNLNPSLQQMQNYTDEEKIQVYNAHPIGWQPSSK